MDTPPKIQPILSFDKKPLRKQQLVYQMGYDKGGKLQLFEFVIMDLDFSKNLVHMLRTNNKDDGVAQQHKVPGHRVHTNPIELLEHYESMLEAQIKNLPEELERLRQNKMEILKRYTNAEEINVGIDEDQEI